MLLLFSNQIISFSVLQLVMAKQTWQCLRSFSRLVCI
uniref:Uncharacterized protein n=1 Tax=Arundo donax TaxID=35708 RepID=A0A0A8Z948_ARUDO